MIRSLIGFFFQFNSHNLHMIASIAFELSLKLECNVKINCQNWTIQLLQMLKSNIVYFWGKTLSFPVYEMNVYYIHVTQHILRMECISNIFVYKFIVKFNVNHIYKYICHLIWMQEFQLILIESIKWHAIYLIANLKIWEFGLSCKKKKNFCHTSCFVDTSFLV